MNRRYQVNIHGHRVGFHYNPAVKTWKVLWDGTLYTGEAGTLNAAREAVRKVILERGK